MAYQEFIVSDLAGAYDLNGGGQSSAADGAALVEVACTVAGGTPTILTKLVGDTWENCGVSVGDCLVFDVAALKERRRITNLNNMEATVHAACTPAVGKTTFVGGHLADLSVAVTAVSSLFSAFSNGVPPRINVKGNTAIAATITPSAAYTSLIPLIIQGYGTTFGDKPTTKPQVSYGGGKVLMCNSDFVFLNDIHLIGSQNSSTLKFDFNGKIIGGLRSTFEATAGTGINFYYPQYGSFINCMIKNSGTATGKLMYYSYFGTLFYDCLLQNGLIDTVRSVFVNCFGTDVYINDIEKGTSIIGGNLGAYANQNLMTLNNSGQGILTIINSVLQGADGVGKVGLTSDAAGYSAIYELCNDWYDNTADRSNISNWMDGTGNIAVDPDTDANGYPNPTSPLIAAGTPDYTEIGPYTRRRPKRYPIIRSVK